MPGMGSQAAAVLAELLAIPDAIEQLEQLDRELLTPATMPSSSSASRRSASRSLMATFGHRDPGGRTRRGARGAHRGAARGGAVELDRLKVRYHGAQEAVGRLFAFAQALANDYERFEALIGGGDIAHPGGGRAVPRNSSRRGSPTGGHGRRTGGPWDSSWPGARRGGLALEAVSPLHVATYIRTHPGSAPTVKQHLAAIRMLGDCSSSARSSR